MESRPGKSKKTKGSKRKRVPRITKDQVVWRSIGTKTFSFLERAPYEKYLHEYLGAVGFLIKRFQQLQWNEDIAIKCNTPTVVGLQSLNGVLSFSLIGYNAEQKQEFVTLMEELFYLYPKLIPYIQVEPRKYEDTL